MKITKGRSSATQITWYYSFVLAFITVVMGLSLTGVVGYQLAVSKINDANGLMNSLQSSFIDDRLDWEHWRANSNIDTQDTYVKVYYDRNNERHTFYSKNTKDYLTKKQRHVPLLNTIEIRDFWHPYYHLYKTNKGIHYEIWVGFHSVTHLFRLIFYTIILVMLVSFLIGTWLISVLAKKLNKPLLNLTKSAQIINQSQPLPEDTQLPVPKNPQEVQELTKEINRLLRQLDERVKLNQQFVSDASHELRTPITAIRGHVQFIQRHGKTHPEIIDRSLGFIDSESLRMQRLVESLLNLSRLDKSTISVTKINMTQVIQEFIEGYRDSISQKIILKLSSDVWALVNSDSLEQIILALLNNASKYSSPEEAITIKLFQANQEVHLEIADGGVGISDEEKNKVFERFYRVDKARNQNIPGTGLGLAIVKRLADLNKITITISDNKPKGTKFDLLFKKG